MKTFEQIRAESNRVLYEEKSTADQRDRACARTEALWHNMKIDDFIDWENPKAKSAVCSAKARLEGTLLDLIVRSEL